MEARDTRSIRCAVAYDDADLDDRRCSLTFGIAGAEAADHHPLGGR